MNRAKLVGLVALTTLALGLTAHRAAAQSKDDVIIGGEPAAPEATKPEATKPQAPMAETPETELQREPVLQGEAARPSTRPIFVKRNYRSDIAIGDAIGIFGAFAVDAAFYGAHQTNGVLFAIPLAGYTLGAPIAHLAHGRPDRAGLSFLFRTTALVGGVAGSALSANAICNQSSFPDSSCTANVIVVGALLTTAMVFAAAAIDYEYMADEQVKPGTSFGFDVTGLHATF